MLTQESVLIINCYFKKEMDYRNNQIQAHFDSQSIKCGEQFTNFQNKSEKFQSLQDFNTKSTSWAINQKKCFVIYWIQRFLQAPLQIYSFDAPLSRKSHFQEVSDFIKNELGEQFKKTPEQCKTRFSAIRRKVLRQRRNNKRSHHFDFYDYIHDEAISLCEATPAGDECGYLVEITKKLESLRRVDSGFMTSTKKIALFEKSWQVELKNNEIFKYLQEAISRSGTHL